MPFTKKQGRPSRRLHVGAPKGNKYPQKLKTPEQRKEAFRLFCEHLAAGYSPRTFHKPVIEETIMNMMREYKHEFEADALKLAKAEGLHQWEAMGKLGTMGKLKGFNASSWKFIVMNKLGWGEKITHSGDKDNPLVVGGTAALSPAEQAVLDHFKKKMLYEIEHQGAGKGSEKSKK